MNNTTPSSTANSGFSSWLARRFGPLIAEDRLLFQSLDLSPVDWMTIDDLIMSDGTADDPSLITVLALMFAAMREGSLCLELTRAHIGRLAAGKVVPEQIFNRIDRFLARQKQGRYARLVAAGKSNRHPLIFETASGIPRIYFQKYHRHEKRLHRQIEAFLSADDPHGLTGSIADKIMDTLFSEEQSLRLGKGGQPIYRDAEQVAAIRQALVSPFTIISGGPGTGKTSVMVNIVRGLARAGIPATRMALVAPTGRAAQRMTEAVSSLVPTIRSLSDTDRDLLTLKGSTLHKLLRYRRHQNDFYFRRGNPLPAEVVIIDEVSMVDVVMLSKFLEALDPSRTRLILMGDQNQLPSVEAGAVFAEMIPADDDFGIFKNHLVVLQNNYRAGTRINQLATAINRGRCPACTPISFQTALNGKIDQWAVVAPMESGQWQACLRLWARHYFLSPDTDTSVSYPNLVRTAGEQTRQDLMDTDAGRRLLEEIFEWAGRSRILTLLRYGPFGCDEINRVIEHDLTTHMDARIDTVPDTRRDTASGLFNGAVIMVTRNDYSRGLFNGDTGVVIRNRTGHFRVYFQGANQYQAFALDQLPAWELSFAVTVHKSQGSEFNDVLLVLPDDSTHRQLTREILYTGITRARKRVIIYGSRPAIETAVSRTISRQSGLIWSNRTTAQRDTVGGGRCDLE
ncbi:MAG: exodeoxyribonuclease V subunit alpha [Deltaproteobacteria bacterium]|nr:MAG: exodeoxyribonuclease V subunit alpha [Deltaproteobacteria bacterium]